MTFIKLGFLSILLIAAPISVNSVLGMNTSQIEIHNILKPEKEIDAKFIKEKISESLFNKAFPELAKHTNVREFYIDILEKSQLFLKIEYEKRELYWCGCCFYSLRLFLILCQVNEILAKYENLETKKLVHVELAEEEGLQSYLLAYALHKVGYKNFHLILINVKDYPQFFDNLKAAVKKLSENFTVKTYTDGFEDYLADVFSGSQPRADSFGECDISISSITKYKITREGNKFDVNTNTKVDYYNIFAGQNYLIFAEALFKTRILMIYLNREKAPNFEFDQSVAQETRNLILSKYGHPIPPGTEDVSLEIFSKEILDLLNLKDLVCFVANKSEVEEDFELLINYSSSETNPIIYTLNKNKIEKHTKKDIPPGFIDISGASKDRLQLQIVDLRKFYSQSLKKTLNLPQDLIKIIQQAYIIEESQKSFYRFNSIRGVFYKLNQYMLACNANRLIQNKTPLEKIIITNEIINKLLEGHEIISPLKNNIVALNASLINLRLKLITLKEKLKVLHQKLALPVDI